MPTPDFQHLAHQFDDPSVHAIGLMGSHARGEAGPHSDIDLVRFVADGAGDLPGHGSHLIDDALVVVSNATPDRVERWFTEPAEAVKSIVGLRQAKSLIDRSGYFAGLQARAQAFVWTPELQAAADREASEAMVGWIEEAHKGLEGLRRQDPGRLLNGLFGLTYGLSNVMQLHLGVLLSGDNGFYDEVAAAVGVDSLWTHLRAVAFGVAEVHGRPPSLRERVVAGLGLYVTTAELLDDAILPEYRPLIEATVERINQQVERAYHGE
ncbi:MAG: hypothetical protein DCC55_28090 [Chloroflexi bacterium]|nr:MAG: hypothetical protein DCC55_28090 [Chloroflexota bacterium]